ncbi:MAG: FAD-dependent oxidoreductase [Polyangiales bacterium]
MKHLVILGAGTAGTMVANRMARSLDGRQWRVTVVDPEVTHLYQPGLLFLPFGDREEGELVRPRGQTLDERVDWRQNAVWSVDPTARTVTLDDDSSLPYDLLVVATGSRLRPELTEGMLGEGWQEKVFDFYTLDGAVKLREGLGNFSGGRIVIDVVAAPIKGPLAPLEFAFLADAFFKDRGVRSGVDIVLATPADAPFPHPIASKRLTELLDEKGVRVERGFACAAVDGAAGRLTSRDGRSIDFDLLVAVPAHGGAEFVTRAGLGNELGFIPTDARSLAAKGLERVFVIGDATDVPASKAGSVAHFEAETLVHNLERAVAGKPLLDSFDGHANCFVETGDGKALLIDFNYDTEPLPGHYPLPGVGPFALLEESRINHRGKVGLRWLYWNGLLPGKPMPLPTHLSMAGKRHP